jgi:hypothetical protein
MNSRERVQCALNHEEPDRVPVDLGAGFQTGMHVQSVYRLRQALKLDPPGTPVKVVEPYQMLGEIKPDLLAWVQGDVIGINPPSTMFGYRCEGWKPWTTFDGTPVLVPEDFNTEVAPSGDLYQYPDGDTSVPPSGTMPSGGFYFDSTDRQQPFDEADLNLSDNLEEFGPIGQDDLDFFEQQAKHLHAETDKALYINIGGTAFGDIALVPAPWLKHPKGIRGVEEWYVSTAIRQDYVKAIFERQCEIALENLQKVFDVVGNLVDVIFMSGTDFGGQDRPMLSTASYRELFLPYHKQLNDWIHGHTTWKTFIHTDGSLKPLMPSFVEAGFDVMNPVQWTAKNMDPREIKAQFGRDLVFWGGGVDTQRTLPFGTPDEVRAEVQQRVADFAPGGGWIFTTVHNVQPLVPPENLIAMYETINAHRDYPITTT